MPTLTNQGIVVEVDDDGYLLDGADWTPEVAELLARAAGLSPLTDRHWKVIALYREETARRGRPPDRDRLEELAGIGAGVLEGLFPGGSLRLVARVAGLPRPLCPRESS